MKSGTVSTEDPIEQRLKLVAGSHPDLRTAARLYEAVLPLLRDADIHVAPLQLDPARVRTGLESGVPVLAGIDLEVDFRELEELMLRLVRSVETMDVSERKPGGWRSWLGTADPAGEPEFRTLKRAAADIRRSYEDGCLDLGAILTCAAGGDHDGAAERAAGLQLDSGLLWTLAQNALKPALNSCRREITPLLDGLQWDRGFCFICGSRATLAELQDNDQVKHLRCGQCGADWHFNRLQCLHCGNMDHETQQSLYPDGCDSRRIEACDLCHGYLKVIAAFAPTPPELLAVEDLETLHLDFIAQQRGYTKDGRPPDHAQGGTIQSNETSATD